MQHMHLTHVSGCTLLYCVGRAEEAPSSGRDASLVFGSPSPSWPGLCIALYRVSGCFLWRGLRLLRLVYSLVMFSLRRRSSILIVFGAYYSYVEGILKRIRRDSNSGDTCVATIHMCSMSDYTAPRCLCIKNKSPSH